MQFRLTPTSSATVLLALRLFGSCNGMAPKQRVAIIGGGIAGLSCAQRLGSQYDVTVYDTGRVRPGGRCSSRQSGDTPKEGDVDYPLLSKYRYDHAAQLISIPEDNSGRFQDFEKQIQEWQQEGVVQEFPKDSVCTIQKDGKVHPLSQTFYHGTTGMGGLPLQLLKNRSFDLQQDVWVAPSSGVRYQPKTKQWKLQAKGDTLGYYDQLIIAHNGKCADRIMSKTPSKDLHALLRVNFSPTVPANGGNKMTLNSIYSLTICLDKDSPLSKALKAPFIAGFVNSHPALRMITCQTRKYCSDESAAEHEVWTILSSAKFAKKYKGPQENLPKETIEEVSSLLLEAVEESILGTTQEGLKVLEKRLQLWGAGVPLNVWKGDGFIYDADNKVGVVGDWLVEPSIAGAWTSGRLLAKHMVDKETETMGLQGSFERSESASKLGIASLAQK
jgi:predicted NAD/FAD-dependent oxidoreductase